MGESDAEESVLDAITDGDRSRMAQDQGLRHDELQHLGAVYVYSDGEVADGNGEVQEEVCPATMRTLT